MPAAAPTPLTTTPSAERFSTISLDGEKVTFHSDQGGTREIWVVNFDGTGLRQLTSLGDPNVISVENYYPMTNGDGILREGRTLYVVQNQLNQVAVVHLNRSGTRGTVKRVLTSADFDVPTTVARFGKSLYLPNARFGNPDPANADFWATRIDKR